jgi:hypothetical protein
MRLMLMVGLVLTLALPACNRARRLRTSSSAVQALAELDDREGVLWHEVEGDNVFVGFPAPLPKDWKEILEEAAILGSSATLQEFHATGIQAEQANWRAYADSYAIGDVKAQDAEVID